MKKKKQISFATNGLRSMSERHERRHDDRDRPSERDRARRREAEDEDRHRRRDRDDYDSRRGGRDDEPRRRERTPPPPRKPRDPDAPHPAEVIHETVLKPKESIAPAGNAAPPPPPKVSLLLLLQITRPAQEEPNFGLSGKLTAETNTFRGVVIK